MTYCQFCAGKYLTIPGIYKLGRIFEASNPLKIVSCINAVILWDMIISQLQKVFTEKF